MPVVKQRQIPSGTLKLKQLKNDTNRSDNRFKYVVEFPDGDRVLAGFTKPKGKERFDRIVEQRRNGGRRVGAMGAVKGMEQGVNSILTGGGRF